MEENSLEAGRGRHLKSPGVQKRPSLLEAGLLSARQDISLRVS
jgi:hypothetical protein